MQSEGQGTTDLVTGMFMSPAAADRAVQDLHALGFRAEDISVVMRDSDQAQHFAQQSQSRAISGQGREVAEGAGWGVGIGGTIGAIIAAATATSAATAVALTGGVAAPFVVGPLVAVLAGAGAGGFAGGVIGWLVGLGFPKEHAERYAQALDSGGILLAVYANQAQAQKVREAFDAAGAAVVRDAPASTLNTPITR